MTKTKAAAIVAILTVTAAAVVLGIGAVGAFAGPQQEEPELEEFVPTEQLPADSAVAFPVDI